MYTEIQEAVNFLARFLYGKVPRRKVCLFVEQLANFLVLKYHDHWFPLESQRESSFRAVQINCRGQSEQLLAVAATSVGLELDELLQFLSSELTLWINPGEVCYRVGENGVLKSLYNETNKDGQQQTMNKPQMGPDGDSAVPVVPCSLTLNLNSPIGCSWLVAHTQLGTSAPVFELSTPNDIKFTVGTFALTRFGTSKQKTNLAALKQIQRKAALAAAAQQFPVELSPSSARHHQQQMPVAPPFGNPFA